MVKDSHYDKSAITEQIRTIACLLILCYAECIILTGKEGFYARNHPAR